MAFVPEEYFKPSILRETPTIPCEVQTGKVYIHCDMYVYYNFGDPAFVKLKGQDAYVVRGSGTDLKLQLYQNFNLLPQDTAYLGKMALLGERQVRNSDARSCIDVIFCVNKSMPCLKCIYS